MATVQQQAPKGPSDKSPMRVLRETEYRVLLGQLQSYVDAPIFTDEFVLTVVESLSDSELSAQVSEIRDTLRTLGGVTRIR